MKEKKTRGRVAQEAARLLYHRYYREYKQAKEEAAKMLGLSALPSNFEVAVELDRLADESEGPDARRRLNRLLRQEALKVMTDLKEFSPRLIGGVWRGTARKGSDVDIAAYTDNPKAVLEAVDGKYKVLKAEHSSRTSEGTTRRYFHIYLALPSGHEAEVVVRGLDEERERRRCEIYGDRITGLTVPQIQDILKNDPTRRFVPKRQIGYRRRM